jgi:chromosome segregation ATPase
LIRTGDRRKHPAHNQSWAIAPALRGFQNLFTQEHIMPKTADVTEITLKTVDATGAVIGVTIFVAVAAVAVTAAPAAIALLGLGVLNKLGGVAIGLVNRQKRWGEEINKSALSRLKDYGKQKLHERQVKSLKAHSEDSVKAQAGYVGTITTDLKALEAKQGEFQEKADDMEAEIKKLKEDRDTALKVNAKNIGNLVAESEKHPLTPEQVKELEENQKELLKADKELSGKIDALEKDLQQRGRSTLKELSEGIDAMQQEIDEAKVVKGWESKVKSSPEGAAALAAANADSVFTLGGIGYDVADMCVNWNPTAILTIIQDGKDLVEIIHDRTRKSEKWKKDVKSMPETIAKGIDAIRKKMNKKAATPKEKATLIGLLENDLADLKKDHQLFVARQGNEEKVVEGFFKDIERKFEGFDKAYEQAVAEQQEVQKRFTACTKAIDQRTRGPEKQELDEKDEKEFDKRLKQFDDSEKHLAEAKNVRDELTNAIKEAKTDGMDVLNAGHEQGISKLAREIQTLEKEIEKLKKQG